jgi:hypothetical protein
MPMEAEAAPALTQTLASPVLAAPEASQSPSGEGSVDCHFVLRFAELRSLIEQQGLA